MLGGVSLNWGEVYIRQVGTNSFPAEASPAAAYWQRRFYDFNVWSDKKLREKLSYMESNPVQRKLVQHPKDWPWTSWSFYERGEEGPIRVDPAMPTSGERPRKNPHP